MVGVASRTGILTLPHAYIFIHSKFRRRVIKNAKIAIDRLVLFRLFFFFSFVSDIGSSYAKQLSS